MSNDELKLSEALAYVKRQLADGTTKYAAISNATALYSLSEKDAMCLVAEIG